MYPNLPVVAQNPQVPGQIGVNLDVDIMFNFKPYHKSDDNNSVSNPQEFVAANNLKTAQEIISQYDLFKKNTLQLFKIHNFTQEQAK